MSHSVGTIQPTYTEAVDVNTSKTPFHTHTVERQHLRDITEEALEEYPLKAEYAEVCRKIAQEVDYVLMGGWWRTFSHVDGGVGCLMGNLRHQVLLDPEPDDESPSEEERQQYNLGLEFDLLLERISVSRSDIEDFDISPTTPLIVKVIDPTPETPKSVATWPPKSIEA